VRRDRRTLLQSMKCPGIGAVCGQWLNSSCAKACSHRMRLRPRSRDQQRLPGHRPGLPKQVRIFGERQRVARTSSGGALPDTDPLFAFCVRCGHKANAGWTGVTAAMDARNRQSLAQLNHAIAVIISSRRYGGGLNNHMEEVCRRSRYLV
jgi:hypothetical protein